MICLFVAIVTLTLVILAEFASPINGYASLNFSAQLLNVSEI